MPLFQLIAPEIPLVSGTPLIMRIASFVQFVKVVILTVMKLCVYMQQIVVAIKWIDCSYIYIVQLLNFPSSILSKDQPIMLFFTYYAMLHCSILCSDNAKSVQLLLT